jgi:phage I-like protein
MPWRVVKDEKACPVEKPWAVKNTVTGSVNGRCHVSKAKAVDQQRALYVNVPEAKRMSEPIVNYLKEFSDPQWIDGNKLWVQIYPFDSWDHPYFTETTIDPNIAQALKMSFDNKLYNEEIAINYEHGLDTAKGSKAAGWYRQLEVRKDNADPNLDGLWGLVEFTDTAKEEIDKKEWKYHSGEHYDQWIHPQTQESFEFVFRGGALTNQPWVKGMVPLNFSELMVEKPAGSVVSPKEDEGLPDDLTTTSESAPQEHAEPGQPERLDERNDDDAADSGSRIDTPPGIPGITIAEDGVDESRLRDLLGIGSETSIESAIEQLVAEITPIREAAKTHSESKAFSEAYPEQARKLAELETKDRAREAKVFSESFANIRDTDGKLTGKGYSQVVLDKLEELHKAFSEGRANINDVSEILTLAGQQGHVVDFGEAGSSIAHPDSDVDIPTGQGAAKAYSDAVTAVMKENEGMTAIEAAAKVVEDKPDLYKNYRESLPGRRS